MSAADTHERCAECPVHSTEFCSEHPVIAKDVNRIMGGVQLGAFVITIVFGAGFFLLHERITKVEAKVEKAMEIKTQTGEIRYNLKRLMTEMDIPYIEEKGQ
ncbi:MAG: hypothetical protein KQH59_18430 [Desulfobulbaceae bacterium]|nr:hypothetical protein [Desulfobulbaceae bacterium]